MEARRAKKGLWSMPSPVRIGRGGKGRPAMPALPYWCGTPRVAESCLISRDDTAPLFFSAKKCANQGASAITGLFYFLSGLAEGEASQSKFSPLKVIPFS